MKRKKQSEGNWVQIMCVNVGSNERSCDTAYTCRGTATANLGYLRTHRELKGELCERKLDQSARVRPIALWLLAIIGRLESVGQRTKARPRKPTGLKEGGFSYVQRGRSARERLPRQRD